MNFVGHKLTSRDDYAISLTAACALFGKALESLRQHTSTKPSIIPFAIILALPRLCSLYIVTPESETI
jgi:hypothetical protein